LEVTEEQLAVIAPHWAYYQQRMAVLNSTVTEAQQILLETKYRRGDCEQIIATKVCEN